MHLQRASCNLRCKDTLFFWYQQENPTMLYEMVGLLYEIFIWKGYLEAENGDGIDISSRMESHRGTVQKDKAQTITTMGGENVGVVISEKKCWSVKKDSWKGIYIYIWIKLCMQM